MNLYDEFEQRAKAAKSLQESAIVLSDLLSGGYAVWTDGSLYCIRQLVARVKGLQIHIYAREHSPPHFHVKGQNVDAAFAIDDCTFLHGNIDGREKNLVGWWYKFSRPLLVSAWNSTRPSDCPVGPLST